MALPTRLLQVPVPMVDPEHEEPSDPIACLRVLLLQLNLTCVVLRHELGNEYMFVI